MVRKSLQLFSKSHTSALQSPFLQWVPLVLRLLKNQILKKYIFVTHSYSRAENMRTLSPFPNCQKINAVEIRATNVGTLHCRATHFAHSTCAHLVLITHDYTPGMLRAFCPVPLFICWLCVTAEREAAVAGELCIHSLL